MEDLDTLVLRTAQAWHLAGDAVVLVTVARTWGSSPRPPGSLMAIHAQGHTVGSVSGGCIEDDLVHRIREGGIQAMSTNKTPTVLRYGISADEAHRFGLPCGGTVELVLEPISARSRIDELLAACQQRRCTERVLDLHTGHVVLNEGRRDGVPHLDEQQLTTFLGPQVRLIVIGAGPVGLAAAIERHFGVKLSKKLQRADWGRRPLTSEHIRYAQMDTHFLIRLSDIQKKLLEEKGRWDDAVTMYRQALGINAYYPDARYNLAIALEELGKGKEAMEEYAWVIRLAPSFIAVSMASTVPTPS